MLPRLGRLVIVILGTLFLLAGPLPAAESDHGHDEDIEHRAEEQDKHEDPGEHEEGDTDLHEGESDATVRLSSRGQELGGIKVAKVAKVVVGRSVVLPGEVGFNEDLRVHVTPRYGCVIREMHATLGTRVEKDDVLAVVESNENLTSYEVRAPLSGRVVAREGAVGAYASEETTLFTVADLSTVWIDLVVYPRHLADVREGARAVVRSVGSPQSATGTISYVAPVFDRERRVALARVVLPNPDGQWRPGMFVRAEVSVGGGDQVTAVESEAVQRLDEKAVVFVPVGDSLFRAVPVTVGATGPTHTEIKAGLVPGDAYVAAGAFELKAKLVTSSLGGHAGHGH